MNAGGLAQMSYNGNNNPLPFPGSGFGSRGRASHVPHLSVNPPTIVEHEAEGTPAPRTSRSHLLAGLRTARKDSAGAPLSAPFAQTRFGDQSHNQRDFAPQTARAPNFGAGTQGMNGMGMSSQMYSRPDQILSPPGLNFGNNDTSGMDPSVYQNLMATNAFLAQRQQMLQQQLMNVQAVAQQFGGMNIGQQQGLGAMGSQGGFYSQQLQSGLQPVVQPVPNNPGIYQVYNPMTGQTSYYPEQAFQQNPVPQSAGIGAPHGGIEHDNGSGRRSVTPPKASNATGPWNRHFSPPRQSPSPPQDLAPLPEPSANAFRPGHRKSMSSANRLSVIGNDAAKSALRSPGFPQTPVDGTFGLGLGRAGEHPIRQPRGPPPLEELVALPTSKHEGSKNFAARQRRRALFSLVRAGNDRRAGRPGSASGEGNSSASENESPAIMSSDADSETTGNSLSATTSIGSLKAAAAVSVDNNGTKEAPHDSFARRVTGSGNVHNEEEAPAGERRRTPMLVLTSAEKRRSPSAMLVN